MTSLFSMGLWSMVLVPRVAAQDYAASLHAAPLVSSLTPPRRGSHPASISACPKLPQNKTPIVSKNPAALSGLGDMGAFTFFKWSIDDHAALKVNVANGNLVLETSQFHIHGTGIDLNIGATYNSLASASTVDMGARWSLTVGTGIFLSVNSQTQAVTLHTSTGALVTYFPDSNSFQGYDEPPNMDATLFHNQDGSFTLVFQKNGECFGFNANGQETYDEDKNTNVISFGYVGSQLNTITDTQSRVTNVYYDSNGRIKQIIDPIDRSVQYLYKDGNNNLTDIIDAAGKTTHFVYSGHDLTSITDPLTNVTTLGYQSGDMVTSLQDAFLDQPTTFDYDGSGDSDCPKISNSPCTVITDANNGLTTYYYTGLLVQDVYDQLNHKQSNQYSPDNNVTQYTDGLGDNSQLVFDPQNNNNLTGVIDGNKATTSLLYGDSNNPYSPTLQTDPQNNQQTSKYDPSGNRNLLSVTDTTSNGTGSSLTYTYYSDDGSSGNGKGTLKSITDGDGNVTSFIYDQYGNLKTETPQSPLQPQAFVEDPLSRVMSVVDGNGVTLTFKYDNLDHLIKITYTKGTSSTSISYGFDDDGNQTSVVDNTGTTSFKYDANNRLSKKTLPNGVVFTSKYDPVGNLKTLDDGGTDTLGTTTYGYDPANRMTSLTEPGTGAITTYGYDDANRRTSITYPGNLGMLIGYDPAGHETSATGGILDGHGGFLTTYSSFQYIYKLPSGSYSNLLQSKIDLDPLTWNTTKSYYTHYYTYDTMSRLTVDEVKDHNNVEVEELSYGYDKAGNRTSFSQFSTGESISYSYPSANELGTKVVNGTTTTSYTYDGNGNLTSSTPGVALSYNKKNQTTAIGSDSYTYSGATQADRVQVNSTTMNYSGLGISSQTDSGSTTYYLRCSCGLLNSERTPDGKTHYYLFDAQDSVVGLMDSSSKNLDNAYTYDPFGQTHSELEGEDNPWMYASGYFDGGTQLYHFGSRYYDPELGRWTQQDPVAGSLGDLGSADRYAYANDNPVNAVDPSGASSISGSWGAFAWILYVIGNSIRLWVNTYLAASIGVVGGIVFGGIGGAVGAAFGSGIVSVVTTAIGAIVGGIFGSLPALYDLYCGGKGVYFNLSPGPLTLSPAC